MPKVEIEITPELNDRLTKFVVCSRGALYIQRSDVIIEAMREYLDRHERKARR
jgi:metal-responsive CopG/Arc/MetJ family transcriptional regulator